MSYIIVYVGSEESLFLVANTSYRTLFVHISLCIMKMKNYAYTGLNMKKNV